MATNLLVTGSHGGDDPHVESKHDALMHAAMLGRGGYILKTRNWTMKPTAKDANNITIPAWDLVVEGRQIYIAAPTDVNIQSGSQGQKRRDLIVARYALNSGTGVETVTLEAIKGKPSAATPADPGIETGSIIGGGRGPPPPPPIPKKEKFIFPWEVFPPPPANAFVPISGI